jgi:hypothetical protein
MPCDITAPQHAHEQLSSVSLDNPPTEGNGHTARSQARGAICHYARVTVIRCSPSGLAGSVSASHVIGKAVRAPTRARLTRAQEGRLRWSGG